VILSKLKDGIPCCPNVVYEQPGKSTWIVDLHTIQLLLNLRFAGAKTDGSLAPINSFTQIKDPRSVYSDTNGKLLLRVDGTQEFDKVGSSQKIDGTTTYECDVCYKFRIPRRCDNIWRDMTYKVRMIGLDATKCS